VFERRKGLGGKKVGKEGTHILKNAGGAGAPVGARRKKKNKRPSN